MINKRQKSVLVLAVKAGELMMKSGAEIYRVEDTITRICKACKIPFVEVFASPTGIFISFDSGGGESDVLTYIVRIKHSRTDLTKISKINKFSREFTTTSLSIDDGIDILNDIETIKPYHPALRICAASVITAFFALLFNGTMADFFASFVVGAICYSSSLFFNKLQINFFIRDFCCCALATFMALIASNLFPSASYGPIIIGALMIFVPGVPITNSIRDFLSGDTMSGLARMTEAFITALSLASGAGVVLGLWSSMGGIL